MSFWIPRRKKAPENLNARLSKDDRVILSRINGATSIKRLSLIPGLSEEIVNDTLNRLVEIGLVEAEQPVPPPAAREAAAQAGRARGAPAAAAARARATTEAPLPKEPAEVPALEALAREVVRRGSGEHVVSRVEILTPADGGALSATTEAACAVAKPPLDPTALTLEDGGDDLELDLASPVQTGRPATPGEQDQPDDRALDTAAAVELELDDPAPLIAASPDAARQAGEPTGDQAIAEAEAEALELELAPGGAPKGIEEVGAGLELLPVDAQTVAPEPDGLELLPLDAPPASDAPGPDAADLELLPIDALSEPDAADLELLPIDAPELLDAPAPELLPLDAPSPTVESEPDAADLELLPGGGPPLTGEPAPDAADLELLPFDAPEPDGEDPEVAPDTAPPPAVAPEPDDDDLKVAPAAAPPPPGEPETAGEDVELLPLDAPLPVAPQETDDEDIELAPFDELEPIIPDVDEDLEPILAPAESSHDSHAAPRPPGLSAADRAKLTAARFAERRPAPPPPARSTSSDRAPTEAEIINYRQLYMTELKELSRDQRVEQALTATGVVLCAYCFDPFPGVIKAILDNVATGLHHARLIARHHDKALGLGALAQRTQFIRDAMVQRHLLRNVLTPGTVLNRIFRPKPLSELFKVTHSRELSDLAKQSARKTMRENYLNAPAEECVSLIFSTEGRCLMVLTGLPFTDKTTALLCRRTYTSTMVVSALARHAALPHHVIRHLFKQQLVKRNVMLRRLLVQHPNCPGEFKRGTN